MNGMGYPGRRHPILLEARESLHEYASARSTARWMGDDGGVQGALERERHALAREAVSGAHLPSAFVSANPRGDWHAEPGHPIKHVAPDLCLGPLIGQSPGLELPTDDSFVAKHRGFGQAAAIVARTTLSPHSAVLCDLHEMSIALCRCCFT
jgi:hypothetical protein